MITFGGLSDKVAIMEGLGMSNTAELPLSYVVTRIMHNERFSVEEIQELYDLLGTVLKEHLSYAEHAFKVCGENVEYVKKYLSGKMYSDQQEFDKYADIQLGNLVQVSEIVSDVNGGVLFDRFRYT